MGRPKGSRNAPKHDNNREIMQEQSTTSLLLPESSGGSRQIIEKPTAKEAQIIDDLRLVRGTFVYRAKPGGRYQTTLRKYKSMGRPGTGMYPINYVDGQQYTAPKWVADWLNGESEGSCADWRHDASMINLEEESRKPPERVPVFRFVIQEYVA